MIRFDDSVYFRMQQVRMLTVGLLPVLGRCIRVMRVLVTASVSGTSMHILCIHT